MNILFDRDRVVAGSSGLLLFSHGPFAISLVESAQLVVGPIGSVVALCLEESDSPEACEQKFLDVYNELPGEVLVLLDLYGGTPCNVVVSACLKNNLTPLVMGGLSMPMLVDAVSLRESLAGDELLDRLEYIAREGVVNVTKMMREWAE